MSDQITKIAVMVCLAALATGCAFNKTTDLSYAECMYPDSPEKEAPTWVCDQPVESIEVQAVGYSRKLASGFGMMKDVAATEARSQLSNYFSTKVNTRMSRLTTEKFDGESAVSQDVAERVQKTLSTMTLSNSRIYRTQVSPSGGVYVLVGLNKAGFDSNIDRLVNTALNNESPELYAQFLKEESDKALDDIRNTLSSQ